MPTIDYPGYDNHPLQQSNTCGQAVIASVFEHTGQYPFARPADRRAAIDAVLAHYGPNWPLRNMVTHPNIIRRALTDAHIPHIVHTRRTLGVVDAMPILISAIDHAQPVVVLLDLHAIGMGKRFTLHWAVVTGYSREENGCMIHLSSWAREYKSARDDFKRAFTPYFLPSRYRNYMIVIGASA